MTDMVIRMLRKEIISRDRRTKIVATLGPSSSDPALIEVLFRTGVDVFRLNFSHGEHADHAARIETIRQIEAKYRRPIGILADIQGPKLRIGCFRGGYANLEHGQDFRLDLCSVPGNRDRVRLPHPEIMAAVRSGARLLVDDGKIRLDVLGVGDGFIDTRVVVGGRLSDRKGVNVPDILLPIPALTPKDRQDVEFALAQHVDLIGLSFVQTVQDVRDAREIIGDRAWVVSKIEKPQAVEDLEAIVAASDAVMVARGDLGVELPPEEVPLVQKQAIATCTRLGRPVIVATQMLESMITAPAPTRAEASDVATAVFDGADAVMLSAETAVGQYPDEAVSIMSRILTRVEESADWKRQTAERRPQPDRSAGDAIAVSARHVAETIDARSIAAYTHGGTTVLRIARQRPTTPLLAITPFASTARRLALVWGVDAIVTPAVNRMAEAVGRAADAIRRRLGAKKREFIVVVAGVPFGQPGATNALRVSTIGDAWPEEEQD